MLLDENLPAEGGAQEELKRCTQKGATWRCPNQFALTDPHKKCASCREKARRYAKAHRKTEAGKATQKRYDTSVKGRASAHKYNRSEKQKAKRKVYNASIMNRLRRSLNHMIAGNNKSPKSLPSRGCFQSAEDAKSHFQSTFEPWMSWNNLGVHETGNAYNTKWHIGHKLPVRIFDANLESDVSKCFNKRNLFAQCARRNSELQDALALNDFELHELRDLWPAAAGGSMTRLKAMFSKVAEEAGYESPSWFDN